VLSEVIRTSFLIYRAANKHQQQSSVTADVQRTGVRIVLAGAGQIYPGKFSCGGA